MTVAHSLTKIGQLDEQRGVFLGEYSPDNANTLYFAYAAPDFLRDDKKEQLVLNFNKAGDELARRQPNEPYVKGTEDIIREALKNGTYKDGVDVLSPMELLNGVNAHGEIVRPDNNVVALMKNSTAFARINGAIKSGAFSWSVSSSEHPHTTSLVRRVRLTDGVYGWDYKGGLRSGVVPVRFYKAKPPQPSPPV